jgi:hypothetical protein
MSHLINALVSLEYVHKYVPLKPTDSASQLSRTVKREVGGEKEGGRLCVSGFLLLFFCWPDLGIVSQGTYVLKAKVIDLGGYSGLTKVSTYDLGVFN